MPNIKWYVNRLKAMKIEEILWRLSQKKLERNERSLFGAGDVPVTSKVFSEKYAMLSADADKSPLFFENKETQNYDVGDCKDIFGLYSYEKYKKAWHNGFQTENEWEKVFSYDLKFKQRDDIGDARTNWELNRHFQFPILAKNFYLTADTAYLNELTELFEDWNKKNPFLMGISWTSPMEVAIRANSWCYTYCFLQKSDDVPDALLEKLRIGIINMTDYVSQHFSKFSSANNHLIVEAATVGMMGIVFSYQPWLETALAILSHEIPRQNYPDGVNKEVSLHYESFFLEAVGLLMATMQKNGIAVSEEWQCVLHNMCCYVRNSIGKYGEVVQFGDDDLGKIFDITSHDYGHYEYVLQMMSCLLNNRFSDFQVISENIFWLFSVETLKKAVRKPMPEMHESICFKDGGVTLLKSFDEEVLIGIDHGALGFGAIAAHGHADALSFQMFIRGKPVFVDAGTYIYHCYAELRDYFRLTSSHNTVTVGGQNQSEMLGAFLWGKRAATKLAQVNLSADHQIVTASHNGYLPTIHTRTFDFDRKRALKITDILSDGQNSYEITFALVPSAKEIIVFENTLKFSVEDTTVEMLFNAKDTAFNISLVEGKCSFSYGAKEENKLIKLSGDFKDKCEISTEIYINC